MSDPEALFNAHRHRLFKYFCRAIGHAEAARDLTQDVFVRVTRGAIPAAPDGQVAAWLFRIARNLALDYHRDRRRRPEPVLLAGGGSREASQDTSVAVNEALASLDDLDRDVFLMREVAGLGYDAIASACGLTPDAVRSRIHRTRLQLREKLSASIEKQRAASMRRSDTSR
jgi:RNA polymerase sigma-70 factor (ECF subfamily)